MQSVELELTPFCHWWFHRVLRRIRICRQEHFSRESCNCDDDPPICSADSCGKTITLGWEGTGLSVCVLRYAHYLLSQRICCTTNRVRCGVFTYVNQMSINRLSVLTFRDKSYMLWIFSSDVDHQINIRARLEIVYDFKCYVKFAKSIYNRKRYCTCCINQHLNLHL